MSTKYKCGNCGKISQQKDILTAPDPFDLGEIIFGCPFCKQIGELFTLCDEPGCKEISTCGFPSKNSKNGYRRTCGKHIVRVKNETMETI